MKRGEFLKKSLRMVILTGFVAGTVHLVKNGRIEYSCTSDGTCGSCPVFGTCGFDKAVKTRENERKQG